MSEDLADSRASGDRRSASGDSSYSDSSTWSPDATPEKNLRQMRRSVSYVPEARELLMASESSGDYD
eukprot:1051511-Prorocentrum_lima.AAC.1